MAKMVFDPEKQWFDANKVAGPDIPSEVEQKRWKLIGKAQDRIDERVKNASEGEKDRTRQRSEDQERKAFDYQVREDDKARFAVREMEERQRQQDPQYQRQQQDKEKLQVNQEIEEHNLMTAKDRVAEHPKQIKDIEKKHEKENLTRSEFQEQAGRDEEVERQLQQLRERREREKKRGRSR